jgi:hypothetical protein
MENPQAINTPNGQTPPPIQPTGQTPQPQEPQRKPRRASTKPQGLYDHIGQTIAYSFAVTVSVALWAAGAWFTLAALQAFGMNTSNLAWWLLPIGITGIEIWLMPSVSTRWQTFIMFCLILAVDVASSWYGVIDFFAGKHMPFGPGFTVPTSGIALHIFAVVASLMLAFAPEKLGKYAGAELLKVWK